MTRTFDSGGNNVNCAKSIKFLYSYGGKILPRRPDGNLRYVGGRTRVLAVDRSMTFAELMVRFGELCGTSMSLKCKLPSEDLDMLVSVTCDEDLANVIDEYDRFASSTHKDLKIRAVLFPLKSLKNNSPASSTVSSDDFSPTKSPPYAAAGFYYSPPRAAIAPFRSGGVQKNCNRARYCYPCCEQEVLTPKHLCLASHLNHWQRLPSPKPSDQRTDLQIYFPVNNKISEN